MIARAQIHFDTFEPVGEVQQVNWYTHTGEYFYSQIPSPAGVSVVRWDPIVENPAGMATRSGAFEGRPEAPGTYAVAWRGYDYMDREVAFTYGEFLVQDGPVIEFIADQEADKQLGEQFLVRPFVRHRIGSISFTLKAVAARPPGITFDNETNLLEGVFRDYGTTAKFYFEARDSGDGRVGRSNEFSLTTLDEWLDLSNMPDLIGVVGKEFKRRIAGGSSQVRYDLTQGSWPAGITIDRTTGIISGMPTTIELQEDLEITASGTGVETTVSSLFNFRILSEDLTYSLEEMHARIDTPFKTAAPTILTGHDAPYIYKSGAAAEGITFDEDEGTFSSDGIAEANDYDTVISVENASGRRISDTQMMKVYNNLTLAYEEGSVGRRLSNFTLRPILTEKSVREPATYTIIEGADLLPEWISFNQKTGTFSAQPTEMEQIGVYGPFVVSLVDGFNEPPVISNSFSIEIKDRLPLEIVQTADKLQRWVYNDPRAFGARNAFEGVTFSMRERGDLPPTLRLNSEGFLFGTTTDPVGTIYENIVIDAVDGLGYTDDFTASFEVIEPLDIGAVGGSFDITYNWTEGRDFIDLKLPRASNTFGEVVYELGENDFGLALDPVTLEVSGKIPQAGTFVVPFTVKDDTARPATEGSITFVITPPMEVTVSDQEAWRGSAVNYAPTRTNGIGPFKWTIEEGSLPGTGDFDPMSFTEGSGRISGKPRVEGDFPLTLKVVDRTLQEITVSFNLKVNPPLPFSFAYGDANGEAWMTLGRISAAAPLIENQSEEIQWTLVSGTLPAGISLVPSGIYAGQLRGIPSEDGIFPDLVIHGVDTGTGEEWTATATLKIRRDGEIGFHDATLRHRAGQTVGKFSFAAGNVTEPALYEIVGNPYPDNVSIDAEKGEISVSFENPGKYPTAARVTDLFGRTKTVAVVFDILGDIEISAPEVAQFKRFSAGDVPLEVKNLIGRATYTVTSNLPSTLTVASARIHGTPETTETISPVVVTVNDSYDNLSASTEGFTVDVAERDQLEVIADDYVINQYKAFDFAPVPRNVIGSVDWSIAPSLPAGLHFSGTTGRITGASDEMFEGDFTITAVDSKGESFGTGSRTVKISVIEREMPEITTEELLVAFIGHTYRRTLTLDKILGSAHVEHVSGDLPEGLEYQTDSRSIQGVPTTFGRVDGIVFRVTDTYKGITSASEKTFSIDVRQDGTPIILEAQPEAAFRVGLHSSSDVPSAANTVGDVEWTATGLEGTGLSIDPATGVISGTPTSAFERTIAVMVTDVTGRTASEIIPLIVKPAIEVEFEASPTLLYNYTIERLNEQASMSRSASSLPSVEQPAAANTHGDQTWTISPVSSLPAGLSMNAATGELEGKPLQLGTFGPFTITVRDSLPGEGALTGIMITVEMNDDPIDLAVDDYTTKIGYQIATSAPYVDNALGSIRFFPENNDLAGTNLRIDPYTGVMTGSFTTTQDRRINVAVTDEFTSRVTSRPLHLKVLPNLVLTGPIVSTAEAQEDMTPVAVTATNVAGEIEWLELSDEDKAKLPEGVVFNTGTGSFEGRSEEAGEFGPLTVNAIDRFHGHEDAAVSNPITLRFIPGSKYMNLLAGDLPAATKRTTPFSHDFAGENLEATGISMSSIRWSMNANGEGMSLPAGLTLSPTTGVLSGTPRNSGRFIFQVIASAEEKTTARTYSLTVGLPEISMELTASDLPEGELGKSYEVDMKNRLSLTNIPVDQVKWETHSTSAPLAGEQAGIPPGLGINATTGVITGTTTSTGRFRFSVRAFWSDSNAESEASENTTEYVITVTSAGFKFKQIAVGNGHTCGITMADGVQCWGRNYYGQLGDNTTVDKSVPQDVVGLTSGVTSIATGDFYSCAVKTDGKLMCWGSAPGGTKPAIPTTVLGLSTNVKSVSAGTGYLCAVMADETIRCLGTNDQGQLGNNTKTASTTPVTPIGITDVRQIAAGNATTCAISGPSRELKCWGYYPGDGTGVQTVPTVISGLEEGAASVAIGGGNGHVCVATSSGNVKCWGANGGNGRHGTGIVNGSRSLFPLDVVSLSNAVQLEAGSARTCAVTSDNSISCWGYNGGFYTTAGDKAVPTPIATLQSGVLSVAVSDSHACAIMADHSARCWGGGTFGQLGNGGKVNSAEPVSVGQ